VGIETDVGEAWDFEESSGNGVGLVAGTALVHSGVTLSQPIPNAGNGGQYNGTTSGSTSIHAIDPVDYTGALSVRIIPKILKITGTQDIAQKWSGSATTSYWIFEITGGKIIGQMGEAGTLTADNNLILNEVIDIWMTTSGAGGTTRMYFNGVLQADTKTTGTMGTLSRDTVVGNLNGSTHWDGIMAQMEVLETEISQADITRLFNGGNYILFDDPAYGGVVDDGGGIIPPVLPSVIPVAIPPVF